MEFRIGHIAYSVKDMAKTLAFYTEKLGFRHIFSIANDRNEPWIEYLATPDGRFIELFYPEEGKAAVQGGTYLHLCLEVDDCVAAVKELAGKGVDIWRPVSQGKDGNFQAWIKDPDGREIEIMQLDESSEQYKARK